MVAVNPDAGETIGWPDLVRTVATAYRRARPRGHPVVLTRNYGEAGAIERYGPALGVPAAFSGHNAFHDWGPPPAGSRPIVVVGRVDAARFFSGCKRAGRITNTARIDNDEHGAAVIVCSVTRAPWRALWPRLRRLG